MKLNNDGTATNQEHYKKAAMQPIEVMQRLFTKEQFLGFKVIVSSEKKI